MRYRKETITLLEEALNHLWTIQERDGRVPNVCYAITKARHALNWNDPPKSPQHNRRLAAYLAIGNLISKRLGNHSYVSEWLETKLNVKLYDHASHGLGRANRQLILYRRAWVRDMIRTLENGGDL